MDNVANEPAKTENQSTQIVYKEKNKLSNIFTRSLLSLLLVLCGIAIVWQMLQSRTKNNEIKTAKEQLSQLEKDKNLVQNQVSDLKDKVKNLTAAPAPDTKSDDESIKDAARAYVRAVTATQNDANFTYTIMKKESDFARVNVGVPEGGGYAMVLKKSNSLWVRVYEGQGNPSQADISKFSIPAGLFPTN
ncbi:hypothetical protein IPO96_04140 [Candidatus Saccharibacteria bacterium]|jgi:cell division protein FtsL|nr:MAG: hypothetical protein IPO96_04140 [Candidatus Saccharibacteria bacterium]